MKKIEIPLKKLEIEAIGTLKKYMLVTSGINEPGKFNSMTVDWGFFGAIWRRPCVLLSIRPIRYTYEFISSCADFTVSTFPQTYRDILLMLGKKSGRDCNKMEESGLTAIDSTKVKAPSFTQAVMTLECKKIFVTDLKKEDILDPRVIAEWYPEDNYHKIIIGEIVAVFKSV